MFLDYFREKDPALDNAIAEGFKELESMTLDTREASATVDQLTKLYALKPKRMSKDTLAIVAGNVGIAGMIIAFEKSNVITSKVASFLTKIK